MNEDLDSMSDDDFEKFLLLAPLPGIIDLEDAEIVMADGSWTSVGVMRVSVASISAWWPLD